MSKEVDEDLIPMFDMFQEENKHLAGIKHWEQKLYHNTLEDYTKFTRIIRKYLASVRGILFSVCETSLQNRIETELGYKIMVKKNRFCAISVQFSEK